MSLPGHYLDQDASVRAFLQRARVRPTAQRIALARLLFGGAHRHVTATQLHLETTALGLPVSVATVYNTLGHLVGAGLLNEVVVDRDRTYYDTNTTPHCHIFHTRTGELTDAPLPTLSAPDVGDATVVGVDVLFRVR